MNILMIGRNDGGTMSHTVRNLKDATGMTFYRSNIVNYKGLKVYKKKQFLKYYYDFVRLSLKADVVHLLSLQVPGIVFFLKLIRKPFVIEWTGSDIRNPELLYEGYKTDYKESKKISERNQKPFKKVVNIVSSAILINHCINPKVVYIPHRIYLDDYPFNPTFHDPLRIAHAPSNRSAKGTDKILEILDNVDLIEGVDNEECIKRINKCDIFIDQFVWGEHGMASIEAVALGKLVLCNITHDKPVPVIKCTLDELKWFILFLNINKGKIKQAVQVRRKFLEQQVDKAIKDLEEIYSKAVEIKGCKFFTITPAQYKDELEWKYKRNPESWFKDNYGF